MALANAEPMESRHRLPRLTAPAAVIRSERTVRSGPNWRETRRWSTPAIWAAAHVPQAAGGPGRPVPRARSNRRPTARSRYCYSFRNGVNFTTPPYPSADSQHMGAVGDPPSVGRWLRKSLSRISDLHPQ